jgi:hypothetical protein
MKNITLPAWKSELTPLVAGLFIKLPLSEIERDSDMLPELKKHMILTRAIIDELRLLIEKHVFKNQEEEIIFFKEVKPVFYSTLIFETRLFRLHLNQPLGTKQIVRKYWKKELKSITRFFRQNTGFYEYLRVQDTHLDTVYFTRNAPNMEQLELYIDYNPKFTTARDGLVAEIFANDNLEQYILNLLNGSGARERNLNLQWTGSKAGLVELIYALQSGGVYNEGQIGIKEIAETFQQLFKVDLGNYYNIFNEIRLRKKNRTTLLDQLREKVLRKMDELDEK